MKRKIFAMLTLSLLTALPFFGQKLHLGITTGLNVATLSEIGNIYDNSALKTGFGGGLAVKYNFTDSWGIQSGIVYEQKGFRCKQDMENGEQKLTGTYNYVTLPLMAEGSISLGGNNRLYGLTGGYAGFKTYAENALVTTGDEVPEVPSEENIHNEDFGWIIGGGIQVQAGNHLLQAGLKYSLGLTEVTEDEPDSRNKSLLVSVTFFF
jgi:opacity protein-like surface antigen